MTSLSGTVEITGIIAGVAVVLGFLTLLGLTAGVTTGVVLGRRAQKKGMSQQSSDNAGVSTGEGMSRACCVYMLCMCCMSTYCVSTCCMSMCGTMQVQFRDTGIGERTHEARE